MALSGYMSALLSATDSRLTLSSLTSLTPPGLPYGDKAVLAQVNGDNGGLIFFIDGDRACTPMPAPSALVDLIRDVATDTINHEAGGL